MAETTDTLWLPVLPSMRGFGPALVSGAAKDADKAGKSTGARFGKAMVVGVAAVGAAGLAAGTALYKVGEVFDDVTDTIRVGSGASGKALDGLVDSAKNIGKKVPADFDKIGSTVADVSTRMGLTGEAMETVASQYLEAGRILGEDIDVGKTSAAFNAFKIEGDNVSGAMDHLFQVSQATGIGMNELASAASANAPAMQTLGFSFEETTSMIGSFDKAGLNSSAMMAAMSKGMVTLAKDGEEPAEAFKRVQGEIGGFIEKGDEAGALNLASKVFGTRGASQFVGAVKSGAISLDDMTKAGGQTGDTILGLGEETMDFAEHWQMFKNKVLLALEPIASRVFGGMGTLMENLGVVLETHIIPAFSSLMDFVSRNGKVIGILAGTVAAVVGVFWLAVGAMKAWAFATAGWSAVTKIAAGVQKLFNLMLAANPIGIVIALIVGFIAIIVTLYKNNETARRIIDGAWTGIKNGIKVAWDWIKGAFEAIKTWVTVTLPGGFNTLKTKNAEVWQGIKDKINAIWTGIKGFFGSIRDWFTITLPGAWNKLRDVNAAVWGGIKSSISDKWNGIKGIFGSIRDFLRNTLGPAFAWLKDKIVDPVFNGIKRIISNVWKDGIKPVFDIIKQVLKGDFVGAFQTARDAVGRIWSKVANIVRKPINFVINTVYTGGIKKVFDKVAGVVGISKLPDVAGIPAFAKGGQMGKGWKLVGEEGPELINTGPGYVYTANETKRMLDGKKQMPLDAVDQGQQSHKGIGGFWSDAWSNIKGVGRSVGDAVKSGLDWVRGGLAKAAGWVLNPLKDSLGGSLGSKGFGGLASGLAKKAIDGVMKFISGKDDEFSADGGGSFGGGYDGPLGRFFRPNGRITSGFGSSRGAYPHAGIDFAVPIGTAVKAMFDGVIRKNGWNAVPGRSGKGQIIDHGQGYSSYTGHLSGWTKQPGERVKAGETTALSGNTGRSTGPHAHRELWKNGKPFNFMSYLHDNGGVLNPGLSMIMNNTRKPEAIYNHEQNRALQTLAQHAARNLGGGGLPDVVTLSVEGHDFKAYVSTVTDGRMREAKRDARRGNRQLTGQG